MRLRPAQLLVTAALAALLALGAAPAGAATGAGGESRPQVAVAGPFSVVSTERGSTVVWRPSRPVRHGDARLELAVDGKPVAATLRPLGDGSFSVSLPGRSGLRPGQLSVVAAGRVVEGVPGGSVSRPTAKKPVKVARPKKLVTKDPGAKGKHKTIAFTYTQPGVRVGGFTAKSEVRARVVLPAATAKGARPLVVFLHGRHGTCYSAQGEEAMEWPCPEGFRPTPSYLGYEYIQKLLASQGYATVSISANGVNGQDWDAYDGGAEARAQLVEHHLNLLAGWNAKGGAGDLKKLKGRLNLGKVVLVGHSRGGEGVNRATVNLSGRSTPAVRGQVLIAPTDFALQVSPGVPTSVILPYCDGDVYDLQGQAYVDQGAYVTPKDKALKSAALVIGANHNYFNTEWTPGLSKAPSFDDWGDPTDPACGDPKKGVRLTAKQQRAVGATYVAAAVRSFLKNDADATRLLDGSPVRARSAGKAVVLTSGFTGSRRQVVSAAASPGVRTFGGMTAVRCAGGGTESLMPCDFYASEAISPHWLGSAGAAVTPWTRAVYLSWAKKGARVRLTPAHVQDLSRYRRLDLRLATVGKPTKPAVDVVLTDTKGRTLTLKPQRQAQPLPDFGGNGQRVWAQTVRVTLPKKPKRFDLRKVRSVTLKARSAKGELFFLDATTSRTTQPKFSRSNSRVARFDVKDLSAKVSETEAGTATLKVNVTVARNTERASKVAVLAWTPFGEYTETVKSVPAGVSSFTVPVKVPADGVYAEQAIGVVSVVPVRDAVVRDSLGVVEVRPTAAPPTLSFPTTHVEVTQGEPIVWPYRFSAPISDFFAIAAVAEQPAGGAPELTSAQVPASYFSSVGLETPAAPVPLSETGLMVGDVLMPMKTTGSFELPTRTRPKLAAPAQVRFVVMPDEFLLHEPVVLTATVKPAP